MAARVQNQNKPKGFTLLEVMIAIAIFAIIGLGCWQVLDRVITSKQQLDTRSAQLHQVQKALWLIGRDIHNIIDRSIRDEDGIHQAAISSLISGHTLTFTRSGWENPLYQNRSNLQRVAYSVEPDEDGNSQLIRYYWPLLDRAPNTEPRKQILLDQVQHLEVQFVDSLGDTQFHWPITDTDRPALPNQSNVAALPAGIRIRLEIPPFGEIDRLFALRDVELAQ